METPTPQSQPNDEADSIPTPDDELLHETVDRLADIIREQGQVVADERKPRIQVQAVDNVVTFNVYTQEGDHNEMFGVVMDWQAAAKVAGFFAEAAMTAYNNEQNMHASRAASAHAAIEEVENLLRHLGPEDEASGDPV